MVPAVIDLTSSPEPEPSPNTAARSALQNFQPRPDKAVQKRPEKNDDHSVESPGTAARSALKQFQPRKDKRPGSSRPSSSNGLNGKPNSGPPQSGHSTPAATVSRSATPNASIAHRNGPVRPSSSSQDAPSQLGHVRVGNIWRSLVEQQPQPTPQSQPVAAAPNDSGKESAVQTPELRKDPLEVIDIEDDSDSSSLGSTQAETEIFKVIRENNSGGIRPFKKRRIDKPTTPHQQPAFTVKPQVPTTEAASFVSRPWSSHGEAGSATPSNHVSAKPNSPAMEMGKPNTWFGRSFASQQSHDRGIPSPEGNGQRQSEATTNHSSTSRNLALANQDDPPAGLSLSELLAYHSSHTKNTKRPPMSRGKDVVPRNQELTGHEEARSRSNSGTGAGSSPAVRQRGNPYTKQEDDILLDLRGKKNMDWKDILPHLPGRTIGSISGHYSELKARIGKNHKNESQWRTSSAAGFVAPFSQAEDDLLVKLKEVDKLDWKEILTHFPGRTMGSISGHYGQLKLKGVPEKTSNLTLTPQASQESKDSAHWSQMEDDLLIKLKEVDDLERHDVMPHFPGRTVGSISGRYDHLKVPPEKAETAAPSAAPAQSTPTKSQWMPYSPEEDALLAKLKEQDNLKWEQIFPRFPNRNPAALQVHYSTKVKSKTKHPTPKSLQQKTKAAPQVRVSSAGNFGTAYSSQEDDLIVKLKEEDGLSWDQMVPMFSGRTAGSLAVRYSTKLRNRDSARATFVDASVEPVSSDQDASGRPRRKRRHNGPSAMAGFISWADIKKQRSNVLEDEEPAADDDKPEGSSERGTWTKGERATPKSTSRILRQRELGSNSGRSWLPSTRSIPDELKEHVFDDIGPQKFFQGTSGDVTCVAWAPNGDHFAAGSIAITDERSMQYNRPCNLLLGDTAESRLDELPEHHVSRPINNDFGNPNSLHSMRETQDQRLFMTVGSVQFSLDSTTLYSAGADRKVRAYSSASTPRPSLRYEIDHPASVDLLSVSNHNVLATACHQASDDSIGIYNGAVKALSLSPSRADSQTERAIYPSALRWGISPHHSNLLLAGFSIDSIDDERNLAGETCLWDVRHESRIEISGVTRNVFDLAWNSYPSSGSTAFAVASTPGVNKVNRGTRTVVQCFAPRQNRAHAVLEFESKAFDINDVIYCPHDNSLIAAGATDGKVYVWDQRYINRGHGPLHILAHGRSLNVLDHDRDPEVADTGVRFLSWGATSSRLCSGSSDGVVKVWNPYRSSSEAHIKDVATFTSAVMSGAFNHDYRSLLIGEDQGRLNLLSLGHGSRSIRSMDRFDLRSAPNHCTKSTTLDGRAIARQLLDSGEIELRPMGALPTRQAVQGWNYTGPFLAPSAEELRNAEEEYQTALNLQNETHSEMAMQMSQTSEAGQELRNADKRVEAAQVAVLRLQSRLDDAQALTLEAESTQQAFRKAEKDRWKLEASLSRAFENCKLECNFLPANADEDAEVLDSGRSGGRIPTALWTASNIDHLKMDVDDLIEAGLTRKCVNCTRPAAKPNNGLPTCEACRCKRLGLTAACEICLAAIQTSTDPAVPNLCERCNFSCFRCGKPTTIVKNAAKISCTNCGRSWTAGALGYELANQTRRSPKRSRRTRIEYDISDSSDSDSPDEVSAHAETLGDREIEHYASRWIRSTLK